MPSPVVLLGRVYANRGVLGDEVEHVVIDVVCGIPRVTLGVDTAEIPVLRCALLSIRHATAISVRIPPVGTDLLLYGIGYAVAISVNWIQVVGGVVLRIGPIEVLLAVGYAAVVGVGDVPHGVIGVQSTIAPNPVYQRASGGVLEVVVEAVAVGVQQDVAGDAGVGLIEYLVKIVDSVSVGVGHIGQRQVTPGPESLLPVREAVAVGVVVVVVAVRLVYRAHSGVPTPREIEEYHGRCITRFVGVNIT